MTEVSPPLSGRASMSREFVGSTIGPNVSHAAPNEARMLDQSSPFIFPLPSRESETPNFQPSDNGYGFTQVQTRARPSRISINNMPPFQFPAPSTPPALKAESDGQSPDRGSLLPKMTGHRRGGSEFIGGDGSAAGPGLMSTSPAKGQGALPSPRIGPGRRGHMHRRSGAISSHDLSMILKPSDSARRISGSAPTTPSDPNAHKQFIANFDRSTSQPSLLPPNSAGSVSPGVTPNPSPPTVQSRPRVGFSDKLEYIPRPLSTISSATSSSMSTIRPSHSLTGSITSIRSLGTSSPPSARKGDPLYDHPKELRPKTAGSPSTGSLFAKPTLARESPPPLPSESASQLHDEASTERTLFFDPYESGQQPASEPASSHQSGPSQYFVSPFTTDLAQLRSHAAAGSPSATSRPRSSPAAKVLKRQKVGKSWTELLSRKGRQRFDQEDQRNAEESPSREQSPLDEFSLDDINFDDDTTCVIRNPDYAPPKAVSVRDVPNWKADETSDDHTAGILDLDATWESSATNSYAGPSGFGSPKRRLHSSGTTGGFTGPGMHYHRRTESAPALSPLDRQSGLHRFGSNPQMADVFEEDENEDNPEEHTKRRPSRAISIKAEGLGVRIEGSKQEDESDDQISPSSFLNSTPVFTDEPLSTDDIAPRVQDERPTESAGKYLDIVDSIDEPRFSVVTKSSDESTVTPTLSNDCLRSSTLPEVVDFAEPPSRPYFSTPDMSTADPSPDPDHLSFDVPRLNTAHSSITDRSLWNTSRAGDSGPEACCSTEDVPSLSSSSSTMMSQNAPFSPASSPRSHGQRSASFSAEVPKRPHSASASKTASKRASLASFSQMIGSSFREKSKLSIESSAPEEDGSQREKKRRSRIGRLMRFWKSRDNLKE